MDPVAKEVKATLEDPAEVVWPKERAAELPSICIKHSASASALEPAWVAMVVTVERVELAARPLVEMELVVKQADPAYPCWRDP